MSAPFDFGIPSTSSASADGTSEISQYELIASQRDALERARRAFGPLSRQATIEGRILRQLVDGTRGAMGSMSPIERAGELGNVLELELPAPQPGLRGRAALLRARSLKPFYMEALRPQAEFNRVLVEMLPGILSSTSNSERTWVAQRLTSLADPTAWQVRSHRSDLKGRVIDLTKRTWLSVARRTLTRLLKQQRSWNSVVIETLAWWGVPSAAGELRERLLRLQELSRWPEAEEEFVALLGRQQRFNEQVVSVLRGAVDRLSTRTYGQWLKERTAERSKALDAELAALKSKPSVTVWVDAIGASPALVSKTVRSLELQKFPAAKIEVLSTVPTALPRSEWVAFVGAGDVLAPEWLAAFATALSARPFDVAYVDEDRFGTGGERELPFFKPDFGPALLRSCDFVSRGMIASRAALEGSGVSALGYERALAVCDGNPRVHHLAEVLLTRSSTGDRRDDFLPRDAHQVLQRHFDRSGVKAVVKPGDHRLSVRYSVEREPLVSIIVPFKDKPELLEQLTRSLTLTRYANYELILVSNNSTQPKTFEVLESLKDPRIKKLTWDHPFNYPAVNNFGAREAQGDLLLFLNNDIEIVDPEWLHVLVGELLQNDVGAVGLSLLFPSKTIQHAGVVIGLGGFAGHVFAEQPDDGRWTDFGSANWTRDFASVTSAAVGIRKTDFEALNGFDERFVVCGSDVDLGVRLWAQGKRVVSSTETRLIHHESATRKGSKIPVNDFWESFRSHNAFLERDPFYSPHLTLRRTTPSLKDPDETNGVAAALRVLAPREPELGASGLSRGRLTQARQAQGMARELDFRPPQLSEFTPRACEPKKITWFLPYFNHPFGGVHTILRFADLWRKRGAENTFVIYDNPHVSAREMASRIAPLFPEPPGELKVIKRLDEIETFPATDVAIATLWTSAYAVLRHPDVKRRAYFVQDYEPLFYPAGSFSALCQNTYDFDFFGLFNTEGLKTWVTDHHRMQGAAFEPSVEHSLFNARRRPARKGPVKLFFYGRPSTDRNAFELGIEALRHVKARFGSDVEIISAGEAWEPAWFDAEGVIENLAILPYAETARLYREVDVGLCFMFTRHPSYLPLELMASGVTVVTNDNASNTWLLKHDDNCLLSVPTVSNVVDQLVRACSDEALRTRIGRKASERMQATTWERQADHLFDALTAACKKGSS